ncbi:hypothetical protein BJ741DRAFT_644633 [Chytriomyces cf. hyalinus JEL632]|nr:hypothetical protein BJ741DRAFT_644633 [Chytriomyces cf. hyalinus JEL632]
MHYKPRCQSQYSLSGRQLFWRGDSTLVDLHALCTTTETRQLSMDALIRANILNPIKRAGKICMRSLARDLSLKRAKSDRSAASVDVFFNMTSAFVDPKGTRSLAASTARVLKNIPAVASPIKDSHLLEMQHCISYLFSRSETEFLTCDAWFRVPANQTELASIIQVGYTAYFRASPKVARSNFLVAQYLTHLLAKIPNALIPDSVQKFIMDVHATTEGAHLTETDLQLINAVFNLCPTRHIIIEQLAWLGHKMLLGCPTLSASSVAVILPLASEESRRRAIEEQWDDVDDFRFTLRGFIAWRRKDGKGKRMEEVFEFWDRWNEIVGCLFLEPSFFF